jgi:hypothetical protein
MKNFNFLKMFMATMIMAITTVMTGCVDDNDTEAPYLNVTPSTITLNSDGTPADDSQDYIEISTNRHWTATSSKTWLTLSETEGDGNAKISFSIPEGTNDEATVTIQISNKTGALAQEYVTVVAGSVNATEVIYNTTVGSTSVSSPYPYVDAYTDWNATGTGASTVTYTGYNATVRASGLSNSGSYDGASGPNVVFFGTGNTYFVVNNITMPSSKDFKLTFGAQCSYQDADKNYINTFQKESFTVELSADGSKWTAIDYTVNTGDSETPYWVFATSTFSLSDAVSALYIRFSAAVASAFRLDDITLSTSNEAGTAVDLSAGSSDSETPSTGEATAITIPELVTLIKANDGTAAVLDATADRTFEAIVQNDVTGGNYSYSNLILATPGATTEGNGVILYGSQVEPTTINVVKGDKVKVTLKAGLAQIQNYKGLYEITGSKTDTWCEIEKVSSGNTITPVTITADKLADYQGMTVTIANATTSAAGTWCTSSAAGTHTLAVGETSFTVYVKKDATAFVDQAYKATTASISGIAMVNNNKSQLVPRDMDDVKGFNADSSSSDNNNSGDNNQGGSTTTGEAYTLISNISNITAGKYLMAAYSTTKSQYLVWTGEVTSTGTSTTGNSDLKTVAYTYADGKLSATSSTGTEIELVAVSGKDNTYYIKSGSKYLYSSVATTNRRLYLQDEPAEWVFENKSGDGTGVVASNNGAYIMTVKEDSNTTESTYNSFIRSYKTETNSSVGVFLFKK